MNLIDSTFKIERCTMAVTLINVFSVPKGKEDEFVKWWQDVKANITKQPGFISGKFHKSIKPESTFNFINVAIWANEDVYWMAYEKSAAPMKSKLEEMAVKWFPRSMTSHSSIDLQG